MYVGAGVQSPGQFLCWCTAPFDVCLVQDFNSGGIALPYLGPPIHLKYKKNLPDAGFRDVETLPVWFENLLLVVSIAATFEACVFLCKYPPLFVHGFLCCLLLGSLASWVTLGQWSWLLSIFLPEWLRAPVCLGSTSVRT